MFTSYQNILLIRAAFCHIHLRNNSSDVLVLISDVPLMILFTVASTVRDVRSRIACLITAPCCTHVLKLDYAAGDTCRCISECRQHCNNPLCISWDLRWPVRRVYHGSDRINAEDDTFDRAQAARFTGYIGPYSYMGDGVDGQRNHNGGMAALLCSTIP